jgi:hypothetical protein
MWDAITQFVTGFQFLSTMAMVTYWIPMAICLGVYAFEFVEAYRHDLSRCADVHYRPTLTIGTIIWHLILAVTPCVNLFAMVFDCLSSVFHWLGSFMNYALVRPRQQTKPQGHQTE